MSFINGKIAEDIVENHFNKIEIETERAKGKNIEWDIKCKLKRKKFSVEIKYDLYSSRSGNLAVEWWNSRSDTPSGISASKAEIWVYVLPDEGHPTTWMTSLKSLKQYVDKHEPFKKVKRGGDNNASLYLYRLKNIITIFDRFDNLPPKEVTKLIRKHLK